MADSSSGQTRRAVVLLGNVSESLLETALGEMVQNHGLTAERFQTLEGKRALVTVSGLDEACRTFVSNSPYVISTGEEVTVEKHWEMESLQSTALEIRGLPKGVDESNIIFYMENKDENTEVESVRLDSDTATVKIVDVSAIPYWLCVKHRMKKQPVEFVEVPLSEESEKKAYIRVSDLPEFLTAEMVKMHFENHFSSVSSIEKEGASAIIVFTRDGVAEQVADTPQTIFGSPVKVELCFEQLAAEAKVLVISGVPQMTAELVHQAFGVLFKRSPYKLEIDRFAFEESSVYVTFTDPTGVQKVMENPPHDFLGASIECQVVSESDTDVFPGSSPRVLMIRNLPLKFLSEDVMQQSLEMMFKHAGGHEVSKMKVVEGQVYIHFSSPRAVRALVKNPPEGGMFLGSPVEYFSVLESEIPDNRPHVLVITGFPQLKTVEVAMRHYLKTVVQKSIVSVDLLGEEMLVKFADAHDAKDVAANPPTSLFLGFTLQFSSRPDESDDLEQNVSPEHNWISEQESRSKQHICPAMDDSSTSHKLSSVESLPTFPVSETPPRDKQRSMSDATHSLEMFSVTGNPPFSPPIDEGKEEVDDSHLDSERKLNAKSNNFHKCVVVKGLPKGVGDHVLIVYMDAISPIRCANVKIAGTVAVVEFYDFVDVKSLRKEALGRPFPVDHVIVVVEALEPSCTIAVSDYPPSFSDEVIAMYFERFSSDKPPQVAKKGEARAVVTFEKHEDLEKVLREEVHEIGSCRLLVSLHHPVLEDQEDSLPPLPSPPPKPTYKWESLEIPLDKEQKKFFEHILPKLNHSLQEVHGTATVQVNTLTIQPQNEAAFLPDWEEQARKILFQFDQDFTTAEQSVSDEMRGTILENLLSMSTDFPDLTCFLQSGKKVIKISGSSATVQSVIDFLNNIVETEEEITLDSTFSPSQVDYVMKFAQHEIDEITPPVVLNRDRRIPGKTTIRGLKKSLDKLKSIANEKLVQSHRVIIPLSVAAHRLLQNKRGMAKMEKHLEETAISVLYGLEKLERAAQIFIMAPREYDCHIAKRKIETLVCEKMIPLSSEKRSICSGSTQEWRMLVEKVCSEHFAAVRVEGDQIVIVGEEKVVPTIVEQVEQFVMEQGAITAIFELKAAEWKIIRDSRSVSRKLNALRDDCKKQRMRFSLPTSDGKSSSVSIELHGDPLAVEGARGRLHLLLNDVKSRDVIIPPQSGLHKICPQMISKCNELQAQHDVVIEHELIENMTDGNSFTQHDGSGKQPTLLLTGTSDFGTKVSVYDGDYTQKNCDALVCFVTPNSAYDTPVLANLIRKGGVEVRRGLSAICNPSSLVYAGTTRHSSSGSLKCSQVIHAVIPPYVDGKDREVTFLDSVLLQILQGSTPSTCNSILITPLTCDPYNYPIDVCAQRLLQAINQSQSHLGMYFDTTIMIFVEDAAHKAMFKECMEQWEYSVKHAGQRIASNPSMSMSPSRPLNSSQHKALAESLGSAVKITKGSMLDVEADTYINSTNSDLDLSKGELSQAFLKACGQELQKEAKDYAPLKPGFVAVTSARNVNASSIYHVALPSYSERGAQSKFRETVRVILRTAKQEGRSSIAIPALGTANLGYPTSVSAKVLFDEVIAFHTQNPTAIQLYHFVMYKDSDFEVFKQEYNKQVGHVSKVASSLAASKKDRLKIILAKGDLTEEKTSVIVNSASVDMQPCNRISHAIHEAAGSQLQVICSSLVDAGISLTDGKVVPTKATGKLKCSKLYHVNMPGKKRGAAPNVAERSLLKKVVHNCLQLAESDGQHSISLPAFCLGVGGYTVSESGNLMLEAIQEFSETNPDQLQEIRIVILDDGLFAEFYEFFCNFFKDNAPATHRVKTSRFKVIKFRKDEGVYVELQAGGVSRQRAMSNLIRSPLKPSCTSSFAFHLFSVSEDSLSLVEAALRGFVDEHILEDCVDLGECEFLLQTEDISKMNSIAEKCGVEIQIQQVLQRVLVRGEVSSVGRACTEIQKIVLNLARMMVDLKVHEWSAIDDSDSSLLKYPPQVSMLLERARKSNQKILEVVVDGVIVEIDLVNMTERDIQAGITRNIQRDKKIEQPDLPSEWSSSQQTDRAGKYRTCAFVDVMKSSPEFTKATQRFEETMAGNFTITRVQRVQNPQEYYRYVGLKTSWQSTGRVMNEKELFHGTKAESIEAICSSGFNRNFAADANAAYFGRGVYFALRAEYSAQDKYSAPDKSAGGEKHILVCSMLVGKYTKGTKDMKVAPALPNNSQELYDTLVNNADEPTIFVAMKDSQAYPRYWITFKMNKI